MLWVLLLLQALGAAAVKDYLFKDCTQLGFCARNRHYAAHVPASAAPYSIDMASLAVGADAITGHITKVLPLGSSVHLPFSLSLLEGDCVRFMVNEDRSHVQVPGLNPWRYNGTAAAAFDGDKSKPIDPAMVAAVSNPESGQPNGVRYQLRDYAVTLYGDPISLVVEKDGQPQVVINSRNFLNVEHYRQEQENGAHMHDFELDFDMFHDSFLDSKNDRVPLGPESVAVDIELVGYTHAYGLAEHADSLALKDTVQSAWPYRLFNVDIFEYETDLRMPMYGSIPLLTATKPEASVGIFWANSADTFVDIDTTLRSVQSHWMSENGVLDLVVILGNSPTEVTRKYGSLTGYVTLPPEFALGYHQCRWNYNDEDDVLEITENMDRHQIPYDTIWLDLEYADQKQFFTWNPSAFPDPQRMLEKLDSTGRNLVVLIDPHFKTDYVISDAILLSDIAIKDPSNHTFKGHCWPGESVWIDALNPQAQVYWDMLFELSPSGVFSLQSNIFIWNDMNEPSVFDGPETSSPRDNLHYGDIEHRSVHNLWGKSFHELTYASLVKRLQNSVRQRPFILARSYFAGSQRTAAMWTGDNMAQWEYLQQSIPMVLTSNVVGMPFAGADVGGFFGDPSKELLTRWYQTGIWYPFFRAHAHIDSRRREPWVAGEPYTSVMRDAVRLRYSLLPTLYTAFYEASTDGSPVWRPMFFDEPANQDTYSMEEQFFIGSSGILVRPVTEEGAREVAVYIPQNEVYYDYTNGQLGTKVASGWINKPVGLEDIPMFVKGTSIFVKRDRYRRSLRLMRNDPFTVVVGLGKDGSAAGKLYLDDGDSFAYKHGDFCVTNITARDGRALQGRSSGNYAASMALEVEKVIITGVGLDVSDVRVSQGGDTWLARYKQTGNLVEIHHPKIVMVNSWDLELVGIEHDEL